MASPNSKTLSIISRSPLSMEPLASPRSTIMRISSSVTASSWASTFMCSSRSTPLVEADSSHTTGRTTAAMAETTPAEILATW